MADTPYTQEKLNTDMATVYANLESTVATAVGITQNCLTRTEQILTEDEKHQVGVNIGIRYKMYTPEPQSVNGKKVYKLVDCAINNVVINDAVGELELRTPDPSADGRVRDFLIKVTIPSSVPQISFVEENGTIHLCSQQEDFTTFESGDYYILFTESLREGTAATYLVSKIKTNTIV